MTAALAVVVVLQSVTVAVLWWQTTRGLLRSRHRTRVIVTLKSGRAFRGLLAETGPDALVLRNAELLPPDSGPVPVDGEVIVLRGDIEFLQRP